MPVAVRRPLLAVALALLAVVVVPTVAPAQTLPTGWATADIGSPKVAGSATMSGTSATIKGSGADVWGTADQFRFLYRQMTGDVSIIARVATLQQADVWTKSGVMIRESLTAGSKHGFALVSSAKGIAYQRRKATSGESLNTTGSTGTAPAWVKLERRGSVITAFRSADGTTWTSIGSETITMTATVYVGLAITSHNATVAAQATLSNIAASTLSAPANKPPTVSLTSPGTGSRFQAPATISVTANASDADGTISKVDFYNGSTLIGSDSTAPYALVWAAPGAGTYSLTAVARDNGGASTTTPAASVTVWSTSTAPPANVPPTVSLTAPAAGSSFTAPAAMTLTASASDSDGTVARVDFYRGTTLIASDTAAPFSVAWNNVAAGTYSLVAVARDNSGATTTSGARTVVVGAAAQASNVVFVPSSNNSVVTSYVVEFFTAGANTTTASPVATKNVGKPAVVNGECSVDMATTIAALPSGTYVATVSAVAAGGQARSAPSAAFAR